MGDQFETSFDVERVHSTYPGTNKANACTLYHVKAVDLPTAIKKILDEFTFTTIGTLWIHLKPSKCQEDYYGLQ